MKLIFLVLLFPVLSASAQSRFDQKITEAAKHMVCPQPDESNPVTLNVRSVNDGDSIGIIVKVALAPGWHIYAYVPPIEPYIAIDHILQLPQNVKVIGDWQKSEPSALSDNPGVLIYENDALFIHKAVKLQEVKAKGTMKAGLYYQTCNLRQCLPPNEKTIELK